MTATTETIPVGIGREDSINAVSYPYSVKIEETAKGIRFHVHVYGNGGEETVAEALKTYENVKGLFKTNGHAIAPMNGGGNIS